MLAGIAPCKYSVNWNADLEIVDAKYRVRDYKVPVEGGEIVVRAVIPGTEDEGRTYPFLFWTHGGGRSSSEIASLLNTDRLISLQV